MGSGKGKEEIKKIESPDEIFCWCGKWKKTATSP